MVGLLNQLKIQFYESTGPLGLNGRAYLSFIRRNDSSSLN